jgi:hypothetical protein
MDSPDPDPQHCCSQYASVPTYVRMLKIIFTLTKWQKLYFPTLSAPSPSSATQKVKDNFLFKILMLGKFS